MERVMGALRNRRENGQRKVCRGGPTASCVPFKKQCLLQTYELTQQREGGFLALQARKMFQRS